MKESKIFKTVIGGREVTAEIGGYCSHSNGEVFVRCGDTVVMVNVTMSKEPRDGQDFFPLGVDYEEKMYSVGKIPGGFKKREGRASDKAILVSRLIDRPLRPLFPKGLFNDVAVVATVLSVEPDVSPEVFAMLGSSIALSVSDIPWEGPTGSVVVGLVDGKYVINPNLAQKDKSRLSLSLAGTKEAVLMVEAGSLEISEEEMLQGILFGHDEIKRICTWVEEIQKAVGKTKKVMDLRHAAPEVEKAVKEYAQDKIDYCFSTFNRQEREVREEAAEKDIFAHFKPLFPDAKRDIGDVLYAMKKECVRKMIADKGVRPDGRTLTEIRPIWCEVGILPRVHGSGVFTRGQTQALTTATLGTIAEVQKLEGLDDEVFKRYMHHYNMPPYSTGEAKSLRSPGRREIGHGALAERALEPVLPSEEAFPYAIRTVSEVISSNGSTSQASVCGSTLALMDAGVPIKAPVAGVAMGLIQDTVNNKLHIMTDIQGIEDFFGDMDFKVAGTKDGITAIQMDIKIHGINETILRTALAQAKVGRLHILSKMVEVLAAPRKDLSKFAPKIISFSIPADKIGDVIGKGGAVINKIIEETGVKIDIDDSGTVFIAAQSGESAGIAKNLITAIIKDVEVGEELDGKVVRILEFGAFVEYAPKKDGMVHISKLSDKRVEKVRDIVEEGDKVRVKVIKIDEKGRVDLKLIKKY
ncbi:MAG: polyribonucleotide nucleotidyltransferase [Christensenellaceae bacterium]|nr:polyribonucleotide nucleotidyltransferase [Christensenellaceae bacterium]